MSKLRRVEVNVTKNGGGAVPFGMRTRYNGVNFRSRLEAKWAAFFDLAGWSWEYQPASSTAIGSRISF
jgi:hypothetical protein